MLRSYRENFELRKLGSAVAAVAIIYGGLLFSPSQAQESRPPAPPAFTSNENDVVCQKLLDEYILKPGKIPSDDIDAAVQLITSRAKLGFWRTVFKQFQESKGNDYAENNLLKILTKMLANDGYDNWLRDHPEEAKQSAIARWFHLPDEVLDTVIARAKEASPQKFDAYVVAIVAANDKRSKDFLLETLRAGEAANLPVPAANLGARPPRDPKFILFDVQFHAAVGLAELGEPAGLTWLVESRPAPGLSKVLHWFGEGDLLKSRIRSLQDLTGLKLETLEEWQAWWKKNKSEESFKPVKRVMLKYP
jgi:hypothetical protein